jgi:predicted enzyme related to lactoylglutathione lyase
MPRVGHFDIMSENPEKTVEFYSKVFGWTFHKWEGPMEYWLVGTGTDTEPGINGGLGRGKPVASDLVLTITGVKLDETLAKVQAAGGKVARPRGPIPGVGWYAAIVGPDGNLFGLIEEDPAAK